MRIIGGHDYYDRATIYGVDPGIVFVRDERMLNAREASLLGDLPAPNFALWSKEFSHLPASERGAMDASSSYTQFGDFKYSVCPKTVIFCGKRYSGVRILERSAHYRGTVDNSFWFWSRASLEKWADERDLDVGIRRRWRIDPLDGEFEPQPVSASVLEYLIHQQITTVYYHLEGWYERPFDPGIPNDGDRKSNWIANGDGLKSMEFGKAIDPVTAFQEIAQWVGGPLASSGKGAPDITDNAVKIAKHGFDKRSFRQDGPRGRKRKTA